MEDTTTQELIKSILSDTLLEEQPVQEAVRTGLMSGLPGTRTVANAQQEDNESLSKKARQVVQDFIVQLSRSADDSPTSSYVEKEANEITDVMVDSETLLNRFNTPRYAFIRNLQDYDPEKSVIKIRNRGDYSNDFLTQMEELAKKSAEEAVSLRESKGITQSLVRPLKNRFEVDILIDRMLRGKETDEQESTTLADTDIDPDTDNADGGAASSDGKGLMSPRLDSKGETPEKPDAVSSKTVTDLEGPEATQTTNDVLVAQLKLASLGYDIGRGGKNKLRNLKIVSKAETKPSEVRGADGIMGKNTEAAIKKFQKNNSLEVTGTLDENTINALDKAKEPEFNFDPAYFSTEKQNKNMKALYDAAVENGITGLELVSLMSQAAHESDSFKTAEEYASGKKYEGRKDLGNTQKGDGERYKGRGFLQVTGRTNYGLIGNALGINLVANPDLLENTDTAAKASIMWWKMNIRPIVSDFSDVERVTKIVNGGFNGLTDRQKYYEDFLGN